jgi:hypothetical protein
MATPLRTYSFKAPATLAGRMRLASEQLADDPTLAQAAGVELRLLLARAAQHPAADQSAFMRTTVETFVSAVEKAARDRELAELYRAGQTPADAAERDAFLTVATSSLRDES